MKRILFIFNPIAGRARIRGKLFDIVNFYSNAGYLVTVYPTHQIGDGYSFLKDLHDAYDLIVCSGGDGTLNEIVSGIMDFGKKRVLAYIPTGSTNDFGRSIGISTDFDEALKITTSEKSYSIDIGKFEDKYFVYVAGFGLFTNISYSTPQRLKNTLGYLAYILEGIRAISELKPYEFTMEYDNGIITGKFIIGLITNSFSVAGFKNPSCSLTELNDGMFEVLLIKMPSNIIELQSVIATLLNGSAESDYIVKIQSACLQIESEEIEWTFDGEYGGKFKSATVNNINKAIDIIIS